MNKSKIEEIMDEYLGDITNSEHGKPWNGTRELVLVDKVKETEDITSFYFKAKDGSKLIKHKAGQFILY